MLQGVSKHREMFWEKRGPWWSRLQVLYGEWRGAGANTVRDCSLREAIILTTLKRIRPWTMNMDINPVKEFERILGVSLVFFFFFSNDSLTLASTNECSIFTHGDIEFSKKSVLEQKDSEFIYPALSTSSLPFDSLAAGCQPHVADHVLRTQVPL